MGQLDQFAKETFALETASVTHGAALWELPPELNMSEVRLDGLLRVLDAGPLAALPAPWSLAKVAGEIVLENKMQGDHLDMIAVDRAVLRRQARQVRRREDPMARWDGETPLWISASHLPAVLAERRTIERVAPGCYHVGPSPFPFLWIAANELPLADELISFLIARSGRALDELVLWIRLRRPPEWLTRMVDLLPMSAAVYEEVFRFVTTKTDDPAIKARQLRAVEILAETTPEVTEKIETRGQLKGERVALRRVLAARRLALSPEQAARIDTCTDLETLARWLDQAAVANSAAEALR